MEVVDEEVENAEIVMTTLNGLPRTWDSFIQGICARKKLVKFSNLWEECSQEEARIAAPKENMGSEDQAFIVQSRNPDLAITKVSTLITGITLEILEIGLNTFAIHVMKKDTLLEIFLRTKVSLTRRRYIRKDIMLMLQRMMNLHQREIEMKVKILQERMTINGENPTTSSEIESTPK